VGRRGARPDDDDRWVFNRLAQDYRSRPGYPPALVGRLAELAGGRGAVVVDLGAGIGHLALPLAARGLEVRAVEPARRMLELLRSGGGDGRVEAVHATAEETGLPDASAGAAILADALQWIDPDRAGREAARVVAPGGLVAVVTARLSDGGFSRAISALLAEANHRARPRAPGRPAQFLHAAAVVRVEEQTFLHEEALSPPRLDAVLRSLSLVGPALGPDAVAGLLARARGLAEAHGGAVWARVLTLRFGRRAGP